MAERIDKRAQPAPTVGGDELPGRVLFVETGMDISAASHVPDGSPRHDYERDTAVDVLEKTADSGGRARRGYTEKGTGGYGLVEKLHAARRHAAFGVEQRAVEIRYVKCRHQESFFISIISASLTCDS